MKIDNPRAGGMHFNVPDRSATVPGLGEPQKHRFWSVFMREKYTKKINMFEVVFYMSMG